MGCTRVLDYRQEQRASNRDMGVCAWARAVYPEPVRGDVVSTTIVGQRCVAKTGARSWSVDGRRAWRLADVDHFRLTQVRTGFQGGGNHAETSEVCATRWPCPAFCGGDDYRIASRVWVVTSVHSIHVANQPSLCIASYQLLGHNGQYGRYAPSYSL